jgi:hypothetical protein
MMPSSLLPAHPCPVNRQWLYPYYFIVFLVVLFVLFGCGRGGATRPADVQVGSAPDGPVERTAAENSRIPESEVQGGKEKIP